MFRSILLGLAVLAATPALAVVDTPTQTLRVAYADLDLSTDVGQQRLRGRIAAAVSRVCDAADADAGVLNTSTSAVCRRDAMKLATASIDATARRSPPVIASR